MKGKLSCNSKQGLAQIKWVKGVKGVQHKAKQIATILWLLTPSQDQDIINSSIGEVKVKGLYVYCVFVTHKAATAFVIYTEKSAANKDVLEFQGYEISKMYFIAPCLKQSTRRGDSCFT